NSDDLHYAVFRDHAAKFGPEVSSHTILLNNPFILDTRDKVFDAFEEWGPAPSTREEDVTAWPWLRANLVAAGHDGLVINIGKYGEKLLRRPFDIAQVIVLKISATD
ncbi:MAG: hypothetical protein JWM57_1050, partial [Phycisphaerales bacterium]|nr:hypothetical protein [Phycisphaerales bacterium]